MEKEPNVMYKSSGDPRIACFLGITLTVIALACGTAAAQSVQVQGVINGRSGATMTLQTADAPKLVVVLTDNTDVDEVQGMFHGRKKQMNMTALIPGLPVQVQGTYNDQNQLVANSVKFKGNDLKAAQDAQAGLQPTEQAVQQNKDQIQKSQEELAQQAAALQQQQAQLTAEQQKIAANKAAIAEDNKRFGELGDYNILGEATVLFGNGQVNIDPQYKPQLQALAQKAKGITAYIIQVQGYASKVGSAALNQKLSQERATNVLEFDGAAGRNSVDECAGPGCNGH